MMPFTIWDRIKDALNLRSIVYKITLPIYLWSIRQPSLEAYASALADEEIFYRERGLVDAPSRECP